MRGRNRSLLLSAVIFILLLFSLSVMMPAQTVKRAPDDHPLQASEEVAGPQNPKERLAVAVFLIWLWACIFVLIIFLRMKIQELDRLHRFSFFHVSGDKK